MAKYLSIVEGAYRATIEEQDDTALWFTHAMKNGGADVGVLLRGDAVSYAVKGQNAAGLKIGKRAVKGPDIVRDVGAIVGKGIPVFVVSEDVRDRGIRAEDMVAGVESIGRGGIAKLVDGYDRIVHW